MFNPIVAVVGLGYVGLPLAVAFGKRYRTIGYDLSEHKINHYQNYCDPTGEIRSEDLRAAIHLIVSTEPATLREADVIVVAVPTPVDEAHNPDFSPLISATTTVGRFMKEKAIVVYESTVYPGATEEVCIPILEELSGKRWKQGFHVGYSPERVNPGDREHTITTIKKVVAGDSEETLNTISELYASVITAGVYPASSIKVAEAAKVIENTQRDLNIALMNELAIVFHRMGIDTLEVLKTAGTKWNFLPFRPGLVGGHCIGVDPYYLTHKAEVLGYHPQVILAGRRINDGMASYIAKETVKLMIQSGGCNKGATVVVFGLTFKENCSDLRNSKVADLVTSLQSFGLNVVVHDPIADPAQAMHEYGINLVPWEQLPQQVGALVVAVAHRAYQEKGCDEFLRILKPNGVLVDIKSIFDPANIRAAGHPVWRL